MITTRSFPLTSMIRSALSVDPATQAMYQDFMTGLDGSPMPSFADNVKPDEAWDVGLLPAHLAA